MDRHPAPPCPGQQRFSGTWAPAGFDRIVIRDPKPRLVTRAPVEDRVVHTALSLLMEPVFLRSALPETFACRPGLGTHRAILHLVGEMRRHRFVVHLDVRSFFPSVDLEILRFLLARRIRDDRFLAVVDQVLESGRGLLDDHALRADLHVDTDWPPPGRGLPIGTRTSQLFASQVMLDGLDHFVKRELHVPGYCRYCDDLYLFGDSRSELRRWRSEMGRWLREERDLRLKYPEARILSCRGHLDALGHRITREGIRAASRALSRLCRGLARITWNGRTPGRWSLERSVAASLGGILF